MIIHCNFTPKNRSDVVPGELVAHQVREQTIFGIVLQEDEGRKKMLRLDRIQVDPGLQGHPAFKWVNVPEGILVSLGTDWILQAEQTTIPSINDQAPRLEGRLSRSETSTYVAAIGGGQFDDQLSFVNLNNWSVEVDPRPVLELGDWCIWINEAQMRAGNSRPVWRSPR
jgi:hypothetical protein